MTTGACLRCGAVGKLGGVRTPIPIPDLWSGPCSRRYPRGWTREEIAEASERLLAFTYQRQAAENAREQERSQRRRSATPGPKIPA